MKDRVKNTYQAFIYSFIKNVLVACPKCSGQAIIRSDDFSFRNYEEKDVRVVCTKCGYNKLLEEKSDAGLFSFNEKEIGGRYFLIGSAVDPFFYLPLWLTENVRGNLLWAYNYEHLNFLKAHVEAQHRERNGQEYHNKSLGSRLPKWMASKSYRQDVLKAIEKLKEKR